MEYKNLLYTIEDGILTVMINRPKSYNSLSDETKEELADALTRGDKDDNVKAIIFTGAGDKAFCAGQDLNESQNVDEQTAKKWLRDYDHLYQVFRSVKKPLIASINGFAVGAGLQLALLTDIRISSESAKFGMTEINVGLACISGTALFWEMMGKSRAVDMVLTGRLITAEEAERYGIITRVVPDEELREKTIELAKALAARPPVALANTKEWINKLSEDLLKSAMDYGEIAHTKGYASGEPQRMMKAFFEKRKAKAK